MSATLTTIMTVFYTRYADDITLSARDQEAVDNCKCVMAAISKLLENELDLSVSWKKTQVSFFNSPRVPRRVLGVTVRKDGFGYNAPKKLRKKARAIVHNLYKDLKAGVPKEDLWPDYWKAIGLTGYSNYIRSKSDLIGASKDPFVKNSEFQYIRKAFNYADRPKN